MRPPLQSYFMRRAFSAKAPRLLALCFLVVPLNYAAAALTLNPLERALFGSRLDYIRSSIVSKFRTETLPLLVPTPGDAKSEDGAKSGVARDLVVIFPGAGGADSLTDELERSLRSWDVDAKLDAPLRRLVVTFDWSEHRGGVATAAFDGEAVGEACAEALLGSEGGGEVIAGVSATPPPKLRSVHSVGISVGAFAANAFARAICDARSRRRDRRVRRVLSEGVSEGKEGSFDGSNGPYVRLTLLDPFTSRGLWGFGYGSKTFGLDVDYAEQVLNTDDPVPTTNDPLPLCRCIDVTNVIERSTFTLPEGETMHCWPVAWYARYRWRWSVEGEVKGSGENREESVEMGEDGRRRVRLPSHEERGKERGIVVSD